MELGNALVVQAQVAVFLPPDQRDVFEDVDRRTTLQGYELGSHGLGGLQADGGISPFIK
jgi:hypothetical protein